MKRSKENREKGNSEEARKEVKQGGRRELRNEHYTDRE